LKRHAALDQLLSLYCDQPTRVDPANWGPALERFVNGRFLLAEIAPEATRSVLRSVGHGFGAFDVAWTARSSGMQLDEQPDIEYGEWLDECYRDVAEANEPATDEVEAIIFSRRFGFRRFTYRRLMLPFRKRERAFLLSASVPDRSISLGADSAFKCK
jgi:hypothetical protein